jgi:glycosyltransferase involved in cell wall biosynthesis
MARERDARDASRAVKVFLACSGLGRTFRGYEAFFGSLKRVLDGTDGLELTLFKGGGPSGASERSLWNLPRGSWLAPRLGEWLSVGNPALGRGYYVEQFTFFLSIVPHLVRGNPEVVYFSDKDLGDLLWRWRRRSGQRFRLLFRNGGPYPPPYRRWDHVQQVTPVYWQKALDAGSPAEQQTLLPSGFDIAPQFVPLDPTDRTALRTRLGLPADGAVVLSVSAVNASHKRLDYLMRELARLPEPRPYLMILGQRDAESPGVLQLAGALLGEGRFGVATVPPDAVGDYYGAADAVVLASTREGFGRAYVEALAHGLPCLAHDYDIARFVLGEHGSFADFTATGALAALLQQVLAEGNDAARATARHRTAFERFSWQSLRPAYVDLIRRCAAMPVPGTRDPAASR